MIRALHTEHMICLVVEPGLHLMNISSMWFVVPIQKPEVCSCRHDLDALSVVLLP